MPDQDTAVLVVEDNATNQVAVGALLDRFGVGADFASTGAKALAAMQAKRYRLVLMDLMLPGMDGYEAARQLRRLEYGTGRHTPIVAVTAVDPVVARGTCIAAGMDGFIGKPIEVDALGEVIGKWVKRRAVEGRDGNGAADMARILDSFLEITGRLLEDLNTAIEREDLRTAGHLAHEVKASSLVARAAEMAQMAQRLERAIRDGEWRNVLDGYLDLVSAFRRATEELRRPVQASVRHGNARPPQERRP